tara:strand:- start:13334 stop:13879 length:546 start_codon:yes stop_codon:yes gene_type:complete
MSLFFASLFRAYSRLFLFAVGLLLGIQVPSFIDQYQQRIDAHFREASINISGFQSTADVLFEGDLGALITYYQASNDEVFQRDAASIRLIVNRYSRLSVEQLALQDNMVATAFHVIFAADREFFDETLQQYSYTVPLNSIAIQWGLALAVCITLLIDLMVFACIRCVRWLGHRQATSHTSK